MLTDTRSQIVSPKTAPDFDSDCYVGSGPKSMYPTSSWTRSKTTGAFAGSHASACLTPGTSNCLLRSRTASGLHACPLNEDALGAGTVSSPSGRRAHSKDSLPSHPRGRRNSHVSRYTVAVDRPGPRMHAQMLLMIAKLRVNSLGLTDESPQISSDNAPVPRFGPTVIENAGRAGWVAVEVVRCPYRRSSGLPLSG